MKYKKEIVSTWLVGVLGIASTFLIFCRECIFSWPVAWRSMVGTATFWIVLWKGNEYISIKLNDYFPWLANPGRRFALGIVASITYTTVAIILMIYGMEIILGWNMGDSKQKTILVSNGIAVFIFCFMVARQFMFAWRELALREEKIKTELMASKFESLKNQVNPHFMFNSLNALSSLVYEDQKVAVDYIDQLSNVLRYVLEAGKQELVTVEEELKVLNSYIFLQKIRFGDNVTVNIDISESNKSKLIPPLVLQILIENAIKHNVVSTEHPLVIKIEGQSSFLKIENRIRTKEIIRQESTALGLKNIRSRYETLSDDPVRITEENETFTVELPLINDKR